MRVKPKWKSQEEQVGEAVEAKVVEQASRAKGAEAESMEAEVHEEAEPPTTSSTMNQVSRKSTWRKMRLRKT